MLSKEKLDLINIDKTILEFGYNPLETRLKKENKIITKCLRCSKERIISFYSLQRAKTLFCQRCTLQDSILTKENYEKSRFSLRNQDYTKIKDENVSYVLNTERTKELFGYEPDKLSNKSSKKVVSNCIVCKKEKILKKNYAIRNLKCKNCLASKNLDFSLPDLSLPDYILINESIKLCGNDPRQLYKHSTKKVIAQCINCNKQRKLRKTHALISPTCISCRVQSKGKGKGKHYCYKNKKIYMRSGWERKFAAELDKNNLNWLYESKTFPVTYTYNNIIKNGTYTPDFYLINEDKYIEIKGQWLGEGKIKYESFRKQYPNIKIELLMKKELQQLGLI